VLATAARAAASDGGDAAEALAADPFGEASEKAGGSNGDVDLLVIAVESSLWLAEQARERGSRVSPCCIVSSVDCECGSCARWSRARGGTRSSDKARSHQIVIRALASFRPLCCDRSASTHRRRQWVADMRSAVPRLRAAAMSSNKILQLLGGDGSGSLAAATPGFSPLPPPNRAVAALRAVGAQVRKRVRAVF
jgi:hypothetical protein